MAQVTGIINTKIYNYTTVFLDHLPRYSYMKLHHTASCEDTLEGKYEFGRMAASHGIIIKQYHDDNGIFRANALV